MEGRVKCIRETLDIRRGIFQGDSLSPLLFVLCMVLLTWLLRRAKVGYEWGNKGFKLNHFLFMDDLNLFAKGKNQIDSLVQTVHIFSEDIGMQFGITKFGVCTMERRKVISADGIRLPDGQHMKDIDETIYKYLGILETDKMRRKKEIKKKFSKEYLRRLRLILRSKLNGKNKIMAVNTWAVFVMRYGAGISKWNTDELKSLDRRTRKFIKMHGALHLKSDIDRVYLSRKMGGKGLISCDGCMRMEEHNLGWYIKNSVESLVEGVKAAETIEYNDTVNKKEFKQGWMREKKELWKKERMYGQFLREMPETTDKKETWYWLRKAELKVETEAMLCASQEQAIRTNYVKHKIDKTAQSPR